MPFPQEFHDLARRVSNWGRWGPDDQLGTLNLLTSERVKAAAALIRTGKTFSLAIPLSEDGPQIGLVPGRENPERTMLVVNEPPFGDPDGFTTSDDKVSMGLQSATHWDSLAHASFLGQIYNGFSADTVSAHGAARCGVAVAHPIAGRGVLLDVARAKELDCLPVPYAITGDDLDATASAVGVDVRAGDIVLIRTGLMQTYLKAGDRAGYHAGVGPSAAAVEWFRSHDVAAVANDTLVFEHLDLDRLDLAMQVHVLHLVFMGLTQGQNFDLDALAADCAADGVYEFFLEASPEPFVRGLGSPVNPIAIK